MTQYLYRKVYKKLLNEAIIDQGSFLEKLVDIINKKPTAEGNYGKLIKKIVSAMNKTKLLSLKDDQSQIEDLLQKPDVPSQERALLKKRKKDNKRSRKKAEVTIHKSLQSIKGLDGEPINLKQIRPLYDSMLKYLESKGDVNIDDCIKSADYYMKDFYRLADKEEKLRIDKGDFDFDLIFQRTNFYQEFVSFKSNLSNRYRTKDNIVDIYADEKVTIVYPTTPESFNNYISESGHSVSWCTQNSSTWYSYNSEQFVCIMQVYSNHHSSAVNYEFDTSIISLKVDFDGEVDHNGTCDGNNNHMNYQSLNSLLTREMYEAIKAHALKMSPFGDKAGDIDSLVNQSKYERSIDGLLDINEYEELKSFLLIIANSYPQLWNEIATYTIDSAVDKDKIDKVIDVYVEAIASLNFDTTLVGSEIDWDSPLLNTSRSQKELFASKLLEKSLNRRSHEKYLIALLELYKIDMPGWLSSSGDVNKNLKTAIINAVNTNNQANFRKVINTCLYNNHVKENVITTDFVEIFDTKGFKDYLN